MYIFFEKRQVVYKTTFVISVLINEHLANEMCDRDVEIHEDKILKVTGFEFQNLTFCPQIIFIRLYGSQIKLGLFVYF
jgi:hypothetical protein